MESGRRKKPFELTTFHPFLRLPTVLQWIIWTVVCPELSFSPLVLNFYLRYPGRISKGNCLEDNTARVRSVSTIHRCSRRLAVAALPDTLAFGNGSDLVRFRKERDVVMVDINFYVDSIEVYPNWHVNPGFSDAVVNLAVYLEPDMVTMMLLKMYCCFPNLRTLYQANDLEGYFLGEQEVAWCQSDLIYRSGRSNIFYWPDLLRHHKYARRHVRAANFPVGVDVLGWAQWCREKDGKPAIYPCFFAPQELDHLEKIQLWPLVVEEP